MNKIKTVIVDDEKSAIETLELLLDTYCPDVEIVGKASDVHSAVAIINKVKPELVFLDISISPDGYSFEILNMIPSRSFQIIFITAHAEYTMAALKQHAFDYILKPIDYREIIRAINELKQVKTNMMKNDTQQDTGIIPLHTENYTHLVKDTDIKFCVANGSYTDFILEGETKITISKPLKYVESILNSRIFQRVHRSYIVNIQRISRISKADGGYIILDDNQIPVSKKFSEQLFSKISM